jgi:hypothetical protein
MPFLGLLLMGAAGAAVWWWRLKRVKEAGSEVIDSVERMRGAYKRKQFRKAAGAAPLASIQNPAIAAVVFFLVLANEKPAHKDVAKEIVRERMKHIIHVSDMDEVLIFADWTAKAVVNVDDPVHRFRDLWMTSLDDGERRQLIAIGEEIADIGGAPTELQTDALQRLKRVLLN